METSFEDGYGENDRGLSEQLRPQFYEKMKSIAVSVFVIPIDKIGEGKIDSDGVVTGSGFIISKYGHIFTCSHVIENHVDGARIVVLLAGEEDRVIDVTVIHDDPASDAAILQMMQPGREYNFCKFGDEGHVGIAMDVFTIANPHCYQFSFLMGLVSFPWVLFGDVEVDKEDLLPTDDVPLISIRHMNCCSGASGAPIFDWKGRVIGMHSFGGRGVGFAIHVQRLCEIWQRQLSKERKKRKKRRKRKRKRKKSRRQSQ